MTWVRFLLGKTQLSHLLSESEPEGIDDTLSASSPSLPDAYSRIMEKIKNRDADSPVLRVLSWILHAARPLKIEELCELAVVQKGDKELREKLPHSIIYHCESLVVYDKSSGIVRFADSTVEEFLRGNEDLPPLTYSAEVCLTYLAFNAFQDISQVTTGVFLARRLANYAAIRYVVRFWGSHAREAENSLEIQRGVVGLLANKSSRDSLLQMDAYVNPEHNTSGGWPTPGQVTFTKGRTVLHILAEKGLATIGAVAFARGPDAYKR